MSPDERRLESPSSAQCTWTRRRFLREAVVQGGAVGSGLVLGVPARSTSASPAVEPRAPGIRRRVPLGRTGIEVSDISFGSFSLESDERLVHHALDRGITHFDTAESYTEGRAEEVLGRALRGRRDSVTLTSKNAARADDTAERQMRVLEESLRRLRTDYIDIYLNHAVNEIARLDNDGWRTFVDRAKRDGKIRASGMSGHAGNLHACLTHALDHQLADVILVAYNYAQQPSFQQRLMHSFQELMAGFDLVTTHPGLPALLGRAHEEGVGVMVMKTLKGARRNDMRPYEAPGRTFSQSAFRWVLSDPAVDGLVVSMTSMEMIDEYVEASGAGAPDAEDLALLARYEQRNAGQTCVMGCGSCEDRCPAGVPISEIQRMRMYAFDYDLPEIARREYATMPVDAVACMSCDGKPCASACPNGIPLMMRNRETHARLG